jgi:DNA polymerase-3 subunit alpha
MYLIFDTETTGLPKSWREPYTNTDNWPRMVQLAWQVHDENGKFIEAKNFIVKPDGYEIPFDSVQVHGITNEIAEQHGHDLKDVIEEFNKSLEKTHLVIGHNVEFDINIVGAELVRTDMESPFLKTASLCTKETSTDFCAIPGGKGGKFKWPTLSELHQKLFNEGFDEAHNASADVAATTRCFLELIRLRVLNAHQLKVEPATLSEFYALHTAPFEMENIEIESHWEMQKEQASEQNETPIQRIDDSVPFTHLHLHTQYSILDGAAEIGNLIQKAKKDGMKAVAITDHGNMFGVKQFHKTALKEDIKPILGCEAYVARRGRKEQKDKIDAGGAHLVLLAKNEEGYHNLLKMVSYSWLEGYYYKPRIDKELLREYHSGIIALSACLGGVVNNVLLNDGIEEAEKAVLEYKEIFGDDFYLEVQRHPSGDPDMDKEVYQRQVYANEKLLEFGKKHKLKVVATNDVHFINPEDAEAQDRLICISTGKDVEDPNRMHYTKQEWFKTQAEMRKLFADLPEVIANTQEVVDKIEVYELNRPPIMPEFELPEEFSDEDEYLKHITYEGARMRWPNLTPEIQERIDFELETIKKMGFPGYFIIVWDFLKAAREMGVSVGPGRGSAAGSAVAYSLRITEIDPVKYQLLFERFLNPDRISMPDIDIDFDDDGRAKILKWVVDKYGARRVAHIITFGTMAAKSAIRDVARVQRLPLSEADRLAKMVPEKPGMTLKKAYGESKELTNERKNGNEEVTSVLKNAEVLEGSVRSTGTHACGIIIGKDDLENYIPISTAKESELTYVTQFDGKHVEDVGLLKMDFLGLKTLSIIKDAVENIKLSKNIEIDIENVSLDDENTYQLFSRGDTVGLFQFESPGMQKYLRELKPSVFEDLIAMNALYRPGPMEYIPQFVARKHGREPIKYDLPEMEEFLKDTYGITVYQEQVMLLSRKLAGFTRGQSDSLRKAMGKKIKSMMDELKVKFLEGCSKNGYETKIVEKIWSDWEEFAKYAFNKSHATCYSYIAYQTGYLKAHYPAEFMSAVLSRNLNDIKKITFFMDESKRMGLNVLGPDVNESYSRFTVNANGDIRFGMAAIKGVGGSAVQHIIDERTQNGPFHSVFDFIERVNLTIVNKRNMEALAMAGALDSFDEISRHQYFHALDDNKVFLDDLISYGNNMKNQNTSNTLFDLDSTYQNATQKPRIPACEEWSIFEKLNKEKDFIGIYLSAHPLDNFKWELENINYTPLAELKDMEKLKDREISIAGIVTAAGERMTKTGKPFGTITLEDYTDSFSMMLFGNDYLNFKNYFTKDYYLLIRGKIQTNPWKKDNPELELKIQQIKMLTELKEGYFKKFLIRLPIEKINDTIIDELEAFTTQDKNGLQLRFKVFDRETKTSVDLFSRSKKITLDDNLINYLDNIPEIEYGVSA